MIDTVIHAVHVLNYCRTLDYQIYMLFLQLFFAFVLAWG